MGWMVLQRAEPGIPIIPSKRIVSCGPEGRDRIEAVLALGCAAHGSAHSRRELSVPGDDRDEIGAVGQGFKQSDVCIFEFVGLLIIHSQHAVRVIPDEDGHGQHCPDTSGLKRILGFRVRQG